MKRLQTTRNRAAQATGFTLVELLMVIGIIALLVAIMMPSLSRAVALARKANTEARLKSAVDAAEFFHKDNDYYPGQMGLGTYASASELLADALMELPGESSAGKTYMEYNAEFVIDDGGYTLSDGFAEGKEMPLLYFPSRKGVEGLSQYRISDNSTHLNAQNAAFTDQASFEAMITDERFDGDKPVNDGGFLLIGAGIDRKYFTFDDVTNF